MYKKEQIKDFIRGKGCLLRNVKRTFIGMSALRTGITSGGLVSVKRDLVSVKRDLVRGLVSVKRDLVSVAYRHHKWRL